MDILTASIPDSISPNVWAYSILFTAVSILLLYNRLLATNLQVNEPRIISSKVPYIGHILGIVRHQFGYYTMMSQKYAYDVFTLPIFGGRLYVVTDPSLVAIIQRHYKELSFWFLEGTFTVKLGGISRDGARLLRQNAAGREPGKSLVVDGMKATHASMNSGLHEMIRTAVDIIAGAMDELAANKEVEVDLWQWIDTNVSLMTSGAVYGPQNPYQNPHIARALKAFSKGISSILVGILPKILYHKPYAAREDIVNAFQRYFVAGGHESGSDLIKARVKSLIAYGISNEDIARFEAVNGFGILINTVPTAFWSIYHLFSDTSLLENVRKVTFALLSTSTSKTGSRIYTIDIRKIRKIPLLVSIMNESLRYHTSGAAPRMVMEDFTLDKYVLKKNSMVMVPNREIHFHKKTWGEAVDRFCPSRFTITKKLDVGFVGDDDADIKKPPAGAFRGFGSGVNMCPGKNFATTEILSVMTMMALRFDVTPAAGTWEYPGDDGTNMSPVVTSPERPVPVKISPRAEFEGGIWCNVLSDSISGEVVFPGTSKYSQFSTTYYSDQENELTPFCVVFPYSANDVSVFVNKLSFANRVATRGCSFAVKGGGHSPSIGSANIDNGITLSLTFLNQISLNHNKTIISIDSGADWGTVYDFLIPFGLTVPGARNSEVGVPGFIMGGGISFFTPKTGFACDNVVNFRVVLANGTLVDANATTNPDLWVALRGGSNNFGIILRFDIRVFAQPNYLGGSVTFPISTLDDQVAALTNYVTSSMNGNFEPYVSVIMTLSWSSQYGLLVSNNLADTSNSSSLTNPSPSIQPFLNIQPQELSTMRISNVSDFVSEVTRASSVINGLRNLFATITFHADASFMKDIVAFWNSAATARLANVSTSLVSSGLTFEPIPTAIMRKSESSGGNSLGLSPANGNLVLVQLSLTWTSEDDDSVMAATSQSLINTIAQTAKSKGLYNNWEYLNYAASFQNPIAHYGAQSVAHLKKTSQEYDPAGFFQTVVPGGFKLFS